MSCRNKKQEKKMKCKHSNIEDQNKKEINWNKNKVERMGEQEKKGIYKNQMIFL